MNDLHDEISVQKVQNLMEIYDKLLDDVGILSRNDLLIYLKLMV